MLSRAVKSGRADDSEAVFEKRFDTYLKESYPIIEQYDKKGLVKKVLIIV